MYINYAKVKANRALGKSLEAKVIKPTLSSIPWAELAAEYNSAAAEAEQLYMAEANTVYSYFLKRKEQDYIDMHPEGGSYEGNMSDEHPQQINHRALAMSRLQAGQLVVDAFIEKWGIKNSAQLLMPEIITRLAGMRTTKGTNGLISSKQFGRDHFSTAEGQGLYRFLMLDSRSKYLATQYKGWAASYCSLVPLVMYAHKLVHRVPYAAWDPEEVHLIVNRTLCEAMLYRPEIEPTRDELLEGRKTGLITLSGASAGTSKNPMSSHRLYRTQNTVYHEMPALAQVMYSQIWCAHPNNRSRYMILDPLNWDAVPPALISEEILIPAERVVKSNVPVPSHSSDLPWG